jgi:phosphoribosylaminoimidazole carboxylase / phosphoribosylaminoimidazole-succinocarboxamide synthase
MKNLTNQEILAERGNIIVDGKTKTIYAYARNPNLVIISNKNAITKNDNPAQTKDFQTKGMASTVVTSIMFNILRKKGIATAFKKQLSESEFLAEKTTMIPLEVIARRYSVGSHLLRLPSYKVVEGEMPKKFDELCVEFFLKTTCGMCEFNGKILLGGLTVEDPFIINPDKDVWHLVNPKKTYTDEDSFLSTFKSNLILNEVVTIEKLQSETKRIFEVLEEAWKTVANWLLIDFKIEYGITPDGQLVVSDVIDNDSWRLFDDNFVDVSKQSFRNNEDLSEVERKYLRVVEKAKELFLYYF